MAHRLFGTDGVRGRAGAYPLDAPTVRRLGAALVRALPAADGAHRVLVGRDTRESGAWIARELAHGVRSAGGTIVSAGVISTPAIAYLTREQAFDAGVVISASHNPFEDNGIKVFSGAGEKFTEHLERTSRTWSPTRRGRCRAERRRRSMTRTSAPRTWSTRGRRCPAAADWRACDSPWIAPTAPRRRSRPRLLRELGFDLVTLGCEPDGRNINLECGSTNPEPRWPARSSSTAAGWASRSTATATARSSSMRPGRIVDGDAMLLLAARHLQATGRLRGNAVVATVMSNIGLEIALRESGIDLVRCPVGDKYVMEELITRGLSLGGEQSGHVIFSDFLFTGDGLVTALNVLQVMAETGRELGRSGRRAGHLPAGARERAREGEAGPARRSPRSPRCSTTSSAGWARAGACWSGTRAPSRCFASCSRGRTSGRSPPGRRRSADTVRRHLGEPA